ncbi:MAG: endonuclease/exonuclease/phosphatase family protein [Jatrophihabitantaceae bacterium]
MPTLRLLTYNVRSMRDDRVALARVIASAEPEVVCVQEAPRFLRWRSLCAELARTSGLVVVGGGRPAGSNLILSSLGVDVLTTVDVRFTKDPGLHQRGTEIAILRFSGATFAVAGTHLDLREEPRLRHVRELHDAIALHVPTDVPTIIAGDINDHPGSPSWQALTAQRQDGFAVAGTGNAFTSTATDPHQRIDGIFADPRILVRSARVLDQDDVRIASDHRPVLAEFDLP